MGEGEIRYVRSIDGVHLAYQVQGAGPIDILEIGGFGTLFPLDAASEQPRWNRFEDRLHRFARVIKFDLRGIGYSDQLPRPPSIADYVGDALAVLDTVGVERAVVLASSFGGLAAIELAAHHPERVHTLVLANAFARIPPDDGYRLVPDRWDEVEKRRSAVEPDPDREENESDIDILAPSLAHDVDVRRWWTRTAHRGAGPAVASAVWDLALGADVRDRLPGIGTPALVIVTTANRFVEPVYGSWLAARLPDAELCEIDAPDQVIWAVPDDAVADEIERYLTGALATGNRRRSMSAVLFTDIVESTAHNAARGDRAWLELLARHDGLAGREINLRGGRIVKGLGDGILAVFPLVSDALDAGAAITAGADDLGIGIRAGVHVAEVEVFGDDVLGLGVTVAARVMGEASGDEVLTTRAVADMLAGSTRRFESRGEYELKGVAGTWELLASIRPS